MSTADTEQVTAEIKRTRQQLGDAVQQLAARADVKRQLAAKAARVRGEVAGRVAGRVSGRQVAAVAAAGLFGVIAWVLLARWRADR
jgi:hypothetical protein